MSLVPKRGRPLGRVSVPEFGVPSKSHPSAIAFIDPLQATSAPYSKGSAYCRQSASLPVRPIARAPMAGQPELFRLGVGCRLRLPQAFLAEHAHGRAAHRDGARGLAVVI